MICLWVVVQTACGNPAADDIVKTDSTQETFAHFVPAADAANVATNWLMARDRKGRKDFAIDGITAVRAAQDDATLVTAYVVSFAAGGFVVVPADDTVVPVLGYSSNASVDPRPDSNHGFAGFLASSSIVLRERIVSNQEPARLRHGLVSAELAADNALAWAELREGTNLAAATASAVEPLITATWSSFDPYNRMTPRDGQSPSQVGCGAVAVGQIMRYHNYPAHGAGFISYPWNDQTLSALLQKSAWDYSQMPDNLAAASVTEAAKDATASFLADVGYGIRMRFGAGVSWSYESDIRYALVEYFRYRDDLQFLYKTQYQDADWNALMTEELDAGRPVFYRGAHENGSGGHFFVLDGFDGGGYFHVNWGWGGASDGYFFLDGLLNDGANGYHFGNTAIIGIAPIAGSAGQECGGYAGYPCADELLCKHKVNTTGSCQVVDWCHTETAAADCSNLEPGTGTGFYHCVDSVCEWTQGGPGTGSATDSAIIARDDWLHYGPYAVIDGGTLAAVMTVASGDPDLYVRLGQPPSEYAYDCRPYLGAGRSESCELDGPGDIYVAVNGYASSSAFELSITYSTAGTGGGPDAVCGNGVAELLEACDSNSLACNDLDPGFASGVAPCNDSCSGFDVSDCHTPVCGDAVIDAGEVCEVGDSRACVDIDPRWRSGTAACNYDCTGWNEATCRDYVCGDGVVDGGELCDGNTLACIALDPRYVSGVATCGSGCNWWNKDACVEFSQCGNGEVEGSERCDSDSIACELLDPNAWGAGSATCNGDCDGYDTSSCVVIPRCGNATLDDGELCDGKPIACVDLDPGWASGVAECRPDCSGWDDATCSGADQPVLQEFADGGNVGADEWRHYGPFDASAGAFAATITGTGDADLYVRKGGQPTATAYDCRPYSDGSNESCTLAGPGQFYVSVRGYARSSAFTVAVKYWSGGVEPELLVVTESGTVQQGDWVFYGPFAAAGDFEAVMTGGGDADLYVRGGGQPTSSSYDCRPYEGSSDESCVLDGGVMWVGINGYAASSSYALTITYMAAD